MLKDILKLHYPLGNFDLKRFTELQNQLNLNGYFLFFKDNLQNNLFYIVNIIHMYIIMKLY